MAWNYGDMEPGLHTMTARTYDRNGQTKDSTTTFSVVRFHKPFIAATDNVDLSSAQCSVTDTQISLTDATIDGEIYNVLLDWRTAAQDFEIIEIR